MTLPAHSESWAGQEAGTRPLPTAHTKQRSRTAKRKLGVCSKRKVKLRPSPSLFPSAAASQCATALWCGRLVAPWMEKTRTDRILYRDYADGRSIVTYGWIACRRRRRDLCATCLSAGRNRKKTTGTSSKNARFPSGTQAFRGAKAQGSSYVQTCIICKTKLPGRPGPGTLRPALALSGDRGRRASGLRTARR